MKRFQYHFEPRTGWMNDPNGLVQFNGTYHIFFQHFPYDVQWGPMHWGHAVSEDLIRWKELSPALTPNESYENAGGCFSGSAVVKDGRLYLFYTAVSREYGQAQAMAWSDDGVHFHKYEHNPVIPHYPSQAATEDFRDPKVIPFGKEWRMLVGTRFNGHGRVLQYRSEDLVHWEFMNVLYESLEYNMPLECPDLYPVDGKWVLMYSKIGNPGYQTQFVLGTYDGETFTPESWQSPEAGPQFYAPQTFESEDGHRILIGWYRHWSDPKAENMESAGALTIPREVHLSENGQLRLYPVDSAWPYLRELPLQASGLPEDSPVNRCTLPGFRVYAAGDRISVFNDLKHEQMTYHGRIDSADLLEDVKGIEVFVNGGAVNFSLT